MTTHKRKCIVISLEASCYRCDLFTEKGHECDPFGEWKYCTVKKKDTHQDEYCESFTYEGEDEFVLYKGVINNDGSDSSAHYRNKLIKLGFPKSTLKYGVLQSASNTDKHVVLIIDATKQINEGSWRLEEIMGET